MRARKAKPHSGAVEYRLRADRKLRKLSLRKMTDRKGKNARARRTSRAGRPVVSKRPERVSSPLPLGLGVFRAPAWHTPTVAFTAFAALVAVVLLIGRPRSESLHFAGVGTADSPAPATTPADTSRAQPQLTMTEAEAVLRPASTTAGILPTTATPAAVANTTAPRGSRPTAADARPVAVAAPPAKPTLRENAKAPVPAADEKAMAKTTGGVDAAEAKPEAEPANEGAVMITGCLESANGAFRLKDPSGSNVPKTRGWRTGFLKKRPAPVELVDPSSRFTLTAFVGHRVAVTGVLSDRVIEIRSLQRVASSCN